MDRQRQHADQLGRFEDADAVTAAGVDDDLPGAEGADLGQAAHQARQGVVGDGEEDEVHLGDDLGHVADRYAREEVRGPRPGLLAHGGDRGHLVAGAVEGGAQDGADPARADDAHREPRRVVLARRVVECAHDGRTYPGRMGG